MNIAFFNCSNEILIDLLQRDLIKSNYWRGNEYDIYRCYYIYDIDTSFFLGVVQLTLNNYSNNKRYAYVDMIEVCSNIRYNGYGKAIIEAIFRQFNLVTIYGEAIPNAIEFWYKIGADFEMSKAELNRYYNENLSACFKLKKSRFMKKMR